MVRYKSRIKIGHCFHVMACSMPEDAKVKRSTAVVRTSHFQWCAKGSSRVQGKIATVVLDASFMPIQNTNGRLPGVSYLGLESHRLWTVVLY